MSRLIDKNRKAQIMSRLHLSLQKFDSFKQTERLTQSQLLKQQSTNDQLTKQLSKLLDSNQRKKNDLRQRLVTGPIGIDLNEQMTELKERMDILRQNNRSQRTSKSYESLTGKEMSESTLFKKQNKMTFDQLYNMQKQKFAALRQRRKNKRMNIDYLEMIGNKQSRKQRNKQLIEQKFNQQMKLLDGAIEGI